MPGTLNTSVSNLAAPTWLAKAGLAKYTKVFSVPTLSTLSNAAVNHWTPGHKGRITKVTWVTYAPATTAAKLATITPSIDGVDVTGGVLALTTVAANTLNKELAGTAITANNAFTATSTITLTASAVTAFVEGSGEIQLEVVNDDTLESGAIIGQMRAAV
jgi:hypothetical protein